MKATPWWFKQTSTALVYRCTTIMIAAPLVVKVDININSPSIQMHNQYESCPPGG